MADFNVMDGLRKAFLAGVGAVAYGAEKGSEVVDEFVKRGELTVEQGRALNTELTRKAKDAVADAGDAALRMRMSAMSAEERAAYAERVAKMAADLDAQSVEVEAEDVEVEDAAPGEPAEDAE